MPTNDFPMVDVQSIRPLEGFRLWVRFTDASCPPVLRPVRGVLPLD